MDAYGKLIGFLEEEVERLKPRTNPEILVPDMLLEFQDPAYAKRKQSLDSARKREYERLTRAYDRYKPQLILKMQNLLDRRRAELDALESEILDRENRK